jgi:VWFA-related protein
MTPRHLILGVAVLIALGPSRGAGAQRQPLVKSGTQLIRVAVLARDRNGRPVAGLKVTDFAVTEDGKAQPIAFFDAASSHASSVPPTGGPRDAVPASTFSNILAADAVRNVTVILLDRLNTAWQDQAHAREAIKKVLSQIRPNDRVALYALDGPSLRVLHDFTSDASALLRAVNGAPGLTSTAVDAQSEAPPDILGPDLRTTDASEYQMQMTTTAAYTTFTALQTIGQHLAGVPGRKSLVWLSAGFDIGPGKLRFDRTAAMQRATHALNTAGISVYPVDARGLIGAFSDPGTAYTPPTFATLDTVYANTDVMHIVADDTGGRVFVNTNDIGGAIRSAIDDADAYYVVGYYAPSAKDDGRYKRIEIRTTAPGVELRYRHGYFATAADLPGGDRKTSLEHAIRDVLDATGIPLTVTATPGQPNQPIQIVITADGRALTIRNDQGAWSGAVDLAIALVHDDGSLHVDTDTTVTFRLTDAQHDTLLATGLTVSQHITLDPNTFRVAIVVRDAGSGSLGSVFLRADKLRQAR